jgi:glycosyltransferase involved in cell wall biosynthesis
MWKLGIPLVWGPVGGGQRVPPGFLSVLGLRGALRESVRSASQRLLPLVPSVRDTMREAAIVLAANSATLEFLPGAVRGRARLMLETAIDAGEVPRAEVRPEAQPLELLWVGYVQAIKGLPLLLEALARLGDREACRLTVIGDGPERRRCERLARRLNLAGCVRFAGAKPREEVLGAYSAADTFVFTSLRDTSGNALLEAMAAGLPCVCIDWAGPGDITSPENALRIRPESPGQVAEDLARAVERLAAEPQLRAGLGRAAREHVGQRLSWECKAEEIEGVYREALGDRGRTRGDS